MLSIFFSEHFIDDSVSGKGLRYLPVFLYPTRIYVGSTNSSFTVLTQRKESYNYKTNKAVWNLKDKKEMTSSQKSESLKIRI